MANITQIVLKKNSSENKYDLEDTNAIKCIKYGAGSSYEDYTPDDDGTVKLTKFVLSKASNSTLGGVKVSSDTDSTNISMDDDGTISATVPIKFIKNPNGAYILPDDDGNIVFPSPSTGAWSLCRVSTQHYIYIDSDTGYLTPVFGTSGNKFNNVAVETTDIDFSSELLKGTFSRG